MNDDEPQLSTTKLPKPYYTVAEAAEILGVSTRTIYRNIADGNIPTIKTLTNQTRIPASVFDKDPEPEDE